jgi:hypothetical protein
LLIRGGIGSEGVAPYGHIEAAVPTHRVPAIDDLNHQIGREAAIPSPDFSEIGGAPAQEIGQRAIPACRRSVTARTVRPIEVRAVDQRLRVDSRRRSRRHAC